MILDYANGGSLEDLWACRRPHGIKEAEVQKIIKNLASGLSTIYRDGIIHRDLKVPNVLLHFKDLYPSEE